MEIVFKKISSLFQAVFDFKNNHKVLKKVLFIIFLSASCFFIVNLISSLVKSGFLKAVLSIIAVTVDFYCQLIYAEGRQLWKRKPDGWHRINHNKVKAVGRFFIFGVYIVVFALFSGVGFFVAEMKASERSQNVSFERVNYIDSRLSQISNSLVIYQTGLSKEIMTGYGSKAQSIQSNISAIEIEQKALQDEKTALKRLESETVNISADMFEAVERAIPFLPANLMKIIVFSAMIAIIYFGLITTGIELPAEENKPSETPKETSEKVSETPAPAQELSEEKKNMLKFIDAALRPSGVLDGDEKVALKTGIPLDMCRAYRNFLRSLRVASTGTPLIESPNQGATRANFPLEYIRQAIIQRA